MLNSVVLTGYLGEDPKIGNSVASFSFAFKSSREKTNFIKIVCFNSLSEVAEKYLHKGARVGIVGRLDKNQWETEDGTKKSSFQIIAINIEFIKTDGRGFSEGEGGKEIPF